MPRIRDGAIHRAAGPELLEECRTLGGCPTGAAIITKGYNLPARYIIHTVGPVWKGGSNHEEELLGNCYKNSLTLAVENNITTIAFPMISTGAYGFPFNRAGKIAIDTINEFLKRDNSIDKILLVCFSEIDYESLSGLD